MISNRRSSASLVMAGIFEILLGGFFFVMGMLIDEVRVAFVLTGLGLGVLGLLFFGWAARARAKQQYAEHILQTGQAGQAIVTGLEQTGMWINNNPVVSINLLVSVPGRPPYPVTMRETVPQILLGRLSSGVPLPVSVDPADPSKVVVDWSIPTPVMAAGWPLAGHGSPMSPPFGTPPFGGAPFPPPMPGQMPGWPPGPPQPYQAPDSLAQPPQPPPPSAPPPAAVTPEPSEEPGGAGLQAADDIAERARRQLTASRLRAIGRRAVATVVDVADTGRTVGGDRVVALTLNVRPEHGEPYRITHETEVPAAELAGLTEGTPLPVRIDPTDQTQLVMDWHRVD